MVATKRLAGVAPEMNLREPALCTSLSSVNKAAHSGFETQRRCQQKSKTGVSMAPQKGLGSYKNYFKKKKIKKPPGQLHPFCIGNRKTVNTFNCHAC